MAGEFVVYGAKGSGSVAVEAALTWLGLPYRVEDEPALLDPAAAMRAAEVNPLRQVPALVLPTGELLTESLAILVWLADAYPDGRLAPAPDAPLRARFLRWMAYVAAQIYALYWIRDRPSRVAADAAHEALIRERTAERIADCWRMMGAQVDPVGPYMLGEDLSVLDLYLTVISRWGPRRRRFYEAAPNLAPVVRPVDGEPRLQARWAARMPVAAGGEG